MSSCIRVAIAWRLAWFMVATPAHAQIASSVDERGKHVFVNEDSPAPGRGSTMSSLVGGRPGMSSRTAPLRRLRMRLDRIVQDAATRHKVDPALVKAVISTESGWNPRAISRKGAVG